MAFDELAKRRISKAVEELYHKKVPKDVRNQIKIGCTFRGNSVSIYEDRPFWKDPEQRIERLVAQLRHDPEKSVWTLYWRRHTERWVKYKEMEPVADFQQLLDEIEQDPIHIFWG